MSETLEHAAAPAEDQIADAAEPGEGQQAADTPNPLRTLASEAGWAPKEDWKGDPDKWVDEAAFLKQTVSLNKALKDEIKRVTRTADKVIERGRAQNIAEAREMVRLAAASGTDEDLAEATEALEQAVSAPTTLSQDPKAVVARFAEANPWWQTDEDATALAFGTCERLSKEGASHSEQLAAAEKAVRKQYPHLFGETAGKTGKTAPAVESGQRASQTAPRKKGWADIPATIQNQATKAFINKGRLTQAEYAAEYWAENG